ncbi:hypothetical protein [Ruminobacter sp. RM87]|uniref:hypothetical protein n=1 Tax=Ruminobacter sp. RM87 TaxID=1200567 RepID=UPI0004E1E6A5|nr:hypothetical protein [Ruminobacter sp. RM87]
MHEIHNCDRYVPAICEPVRETDRVFVLRDGIIYEWDNTVTEVTASDNLEHFYETNLIISEKKISLLDEIIQQVAEGVKYQSNENSPYKTEAFIMDRLYKNARFAKMRVPEIDDTLINMNMFSKIASVIVACAKIENASEELITLIAEEFASVPEKHIDDLQATLWLGRKKPEIIKLVVAFLAVEKHCDALKKEGHIC